jgi:hypothetical protein
MKKLFAVAPLALLAACQNGPKLEDDARYVKLAKVVDVHEFTDAERKEAAKTAPRSSNSGLGLNIGLGMGTGGFSGGFGGIMLGTGTSLGGRSRSDAPQVADGADRYTVQPVHSSERIEVMSYKKYKPGDCVKLLSGHPSEYARLYDPKEGERCE